MAERDKKIENYEKRIESLKLTIAKQAQDNRDIASAMQRIVQRLVDLINQINPPSS